MMFFRRDNLSPEIVDKIAEIRRLLKLPEDQHQFKLIYSPAAGRDGELAVGSRSMLQIMLAFASYVDVPESDLKEQRAVPSLQSTDSDPVEDQVQQGQTGGCLCRRALPQSMVLGGRPRLALEACAHGHHVFVHDD